MQTNITSYNERRLTEFCHYSAEEAREILSRSDVHEDLKLYAEPASDGCFMVHHPLVITFGPQPVSEINVKYLVRKKVFDDAVAAGEWCSAIFHANEGYRFSMLMELWSESSMTRAEFWGVAGEVWTDSDNIFQYRDEWESLLEESWIDEAEDVRCFMHEHERAVFDALPESLPVYRGFSRADQEDGLSYTLCKPLADWFAVSGFMSTPDIEPTVRILRIKKSDVFAYKSREDEIIVKPSSLRRFRGWRVKANRNLVGLRPEQVRRWMPKTKADVARMLKNIAASKAV